MNYKYVTQLPGSPCLNDSTNSLKVTNSPRHAGGREKAHSVNGGSAFPKASAGPSSAVRTDGPALLLTEAPHVEGQGSDNDSEKRVRLPEKCLPPRMKRKVSHNLIHIDDCDAYQPTIDFITRDEPPEPTDATLQNEDIPRTQPQPATRSSARIRTKRELACAPTPVSPKKRKRDENHEPGSTSKKITPAPHTDSQPKPGATIRLTIRIPAMGFTFNAKVDHTGELEKHPSRLFPTEGIPMDGKIEKIEKLKSRKFSSLPVRLRRMLTLHVAKKFILGSVVSKFTTTRNPVGTRQSPAKHKSSKRRTAVQRSIRKGKH